MKRYNIFSSFFNILIVIVLILLYWSSDLLERDVKVLKHGISVVQNDLRELLKQTKLLEIQVKHENKEKQSSASSESLSWNPYNVIYSREYKEAGSPEFPNLLTEDAFIVDTIPNLMKGARVSSSDMLHLGVVGRPNNLHPFSGFVNVARGYTMAVANLAEPHVGKFEPFSPELAIKIEERSVSDESGDKEFWIYLRSDWNWQPLNPMAFPSNFNLAEEFFQKHPVTAHDFKFFYDVLKNPYVCEIRAISLRSLLSDIVEFRVIDDFTFVVRWKAHDILEDGHMIKRVKYTAFLDTLSLRPLPRFVYQKFSNGENIILDSDDPEIYSKDSVWAEHFSNHWALNYIVSCGSCCFDGFDEDKFVFVRNKDYPGKRKCFFEKQVIHIKDNIDNVFQDFKTGKIDMTLLPPNQSDQLEKFMRSSAYANQVKKGSAICLLQSGSRSYSYIGWNCNSLFFREKKIRQAMNLAIDKQRVIEQLLNGFATPVTGPFVPSSPSYNKAIEPWPFCIEEAVRLLDEEGWVDTDGDGIREKEINGIRIPFRFKLYYFIKSQLYKNIVEYISTSLKEIGVDCRLTGLDHADCSHVFDEKTFDAILMGWCLSPPPESLRSIWHSETADKVGSGNSIGFKNAEVDALIEILEYEYDKDKRNECYHKIHAILHEEAPYCFLFFRNKIFLHRSELKNCFVPCERRDLIPGADDDEAFSAMMWMEKNVEGEKQ